MITSASVPVRSLYSDNGVRFAAWNADVDAVSSPQPNDEHHRFYYSEGGYIKAAFANMLSLTPGPPNTIKRVGVIAPTNPPTTEVVDSDKLPLGATIDSDKLPLGATTITAVGWYESSGQRFQSGEVFLSPIVFGRKYTALLPVKYQSTPAKAGDTPESAVACIQISGKRDGITLFTITGDTSSAASKTTAIPGGATLSVVSAGETVVATIDYGEIEARSYLYTHVNLYGEESAPSEPTSIAMDAMQRIYVHANFVPAPAEYFQLTKIRLYRTNTASSGYTKYQFVKDQGVNAGGDIKILDDVENGSLGEICETENWFSPPDGLNGLINLGNGILVAFRGNELHFCEAYVPYAWSPFNVVTLPYQIVGLCPHSGGFVAVTAANPYLVSGVSSDAMTASMLPAMQGGISKRAIANLGDSVVYASNDGLVAVAGGNSSLEFSQLFWSRHDWRADWHHRLSAIWQAELHRTARRVGWESYLLRPMGIGGLCCPEHGRFVLRARESDLPLHRIGCYALRLAQQRLHLEKA